MDKAIYMVGGSKGGVGKSMVTMALIHFLTTRGDDVVVVDADTSNPDVMQNYENEIPCEGVNLDDASIRAYETYFQHRHRRGESRWVRPGVHAVSGLISHRELMRTEIYNDFLRPSGHCYGINLFAFDSGENIGDIRIWRRSGKPDFDRDEVNLLNLVEPGFIEALKRTALANRGVPPVDALARLTRREAAVAELAAKGLADKEIARSLNVTFATVRAHLDNAFAKLGVRNRTQLASLLHASFSGAHGSTSH